MRIEFRYRFEAAHRFLKSSSKSCMTPHGHTWYATMSLGYLETNLNSSQMTVEFSEIKKDWKALIQGTFDHSYMHNHLDPIIEILTSDGSHSRLIPFPGDPTTEIISLFLFQKMHLILQKSPYKNLIEINYIKLEETPTNTIICDKSFFQKEILSFEQFSGWWMTTDIEDRTLRVL